MKGVILAGGTGTRMHPLTRITNKHLLPIYDRPMVTYAIEALVTAGVDEIMMVTGGTHAGEFLRLLGNGTEWGIDRLSYAYQERAGGIAEALSLAERFVDGDQVVVMLADNIVGRSIRTAVDNFRNQAKGARILLSKVEDPAHLSHLGVPELDASGRVTRIVEKPDVPASDYAVTGIYFYDQSVFEIITTWCPRAGASWRSPTSTTGTSTSRPSNTTSSTASGATRASRSTRTTRSTTTSGPTGPTRADEWRRSGGDGCGRRRTHRRPARPTTTWSRQPTRQPVVEQILTGRVDTPVDYLQARRRVGDRPRRRRHARG